MKIIAYARVSSDGQEDGTSLDTQEAEIRAWAERGGGRETPWTLSSIAVVAVFRESVSGTCGIEDRPQLQAALGLLAEHAGANPRRGEKAPDDVRLVVAKRDRLARDAYVAMGIDHATGRRVVALDCEGEETPENRLMVGMLDLLAEYERTKIVIRCAVGRARRKAEGAWLGGQCPWGLRSTGGKQSTLVPDGNQQAAAVAWVFAQRDDGATLAEIATDLNAQGHRTREGHGFTHQTVARILAAAAWYRRAGVLVAAPSSEDA